MSQTKEHHDYSVAYALMRSASMVCASDGTWLSPKTSPHTEVWAAIVEPVLKDDPDHKAPSEAAWNRYFDECAARPAELRRIRKAYEEFLNRLEEERDDFEAYCRND